MRAVLFADTRRITVDTVDDPVIVDDTDVIIRVTSSAICGTDLHMYDGRTGATPGLILGHEPTGLVDRIGSAVRRVAVGDRVVVPTHLFCGACFNCARGNTAACMSVRPGAFGAAYGYAGMGAYAGAQADFLRVPYADVNCVRLPGQAGDEHEDDFVLLADAFVTGWHATELARVEPTRSVAVFGAGTIGLLAAYSAVLKGAAEVYVVDHIAPRLEKAAELGAIPIDFGAGDPVEQIRDLRRRQHRPGEEEMGGVDHAVGFQARRRDDPAVESPRQVIADIARLINPTGAVGIVGVYATKDEHPASDGHADGRLEVPWAALFDKGVNVGFGRTHDRRYTTVLRDLIVSGRASPGRIVTHHAPLDEAPSLFSAFDRRADGVIKAVLHP